MPRRARTTLVPIALVMLAVLMVAPVKAASALAPDTIGFEWDDVAFGPPDPVTSRDNPTVHFTDTDGDGLTIADFGVQCNGVGLGVFAADASALVIRFDVPTRRLSIRFGNDVGVDGNRATLRVFRGDKLIAAKHRDFNFDNLANQVIMYEGTPITRALFVYDRPGSGPIALMEVVDDITLAQVCAIRGTSGPDALAGNGRANGICGLKGADRILGRGGNDMLVGGAGDDHLNGQTGNDLLDGGPGDDTLRSADGIGGNDTIYGGPGDDTCLVDNGDIHHGCESVFVAA